MSLEIVVDSWAAGEEPSPSWISQHGDDMVPVKMIDLLSAVGRMIDAEAEPYSFAAHRLFTCDLPRLRSYLPPEALEEL